MLGEDRYRLVSECCRAYIKPLGFGKLLIVNFNLAMFVLFFYAFFLFFFTLSLSDCGDWANSWDVGTDTQLCKPTEIR